MPQEEKRVFLIEDNPGHAEIIKICFSNLAVPNRVQHFLCGEDALTALGCLGDTPPPAHLPHLIILDLRMPTMDGISVLEAIRATSRLRHLPVVILTTSSLNAEIERAYASGANDFIVKPFDLPGYIDLVEKLAVDWLESGDAS